MLLISKVHISTIARLGALGAALFGGTAVGGFQSREAASPPLADAHVHLSLGSVDALERLAGAGVTVVRDCGGDMKQLTRWRDEIAAGTRRGPKIFLAGPLLDGPKPGASGEIPEMLENPMEKSDPKFRQLEPARRLAASGRPSATSGVIAVGTLRPYHIWCNWLRWPSASYTELVTQVVAGQVLEHVHRLALLVPVAEVDRADCFCELDRSGV